MTDIREILKALDEAEKAATEQGDLIPRVWCREIRAVLDHVADMEATISMMDSNSNAASKKMDRDDATIVTLTDKCAALENQLAELDAHHTKVCDDRLALWEERNDLREKCAALEQELAGTRKLLEEYRRGDYEDQGYDT